MADPETRTLSSPAPAVVLLSGGLDSAVALASARDAGYTPYALSIRYGQRHRIELECARRLAETMGVAQHRTIDIDLAAIGGSALTDDIPVPKEGGDGTIPVTYVPARNTIFLSLAMAWAEVLGARDVFLGINAVDYSGYPDCRPEFVTAFERLASVATKAGVEGYGLRIHAPLLTMTKADIIRRGMELGVDFAQTSSCYDPDAGRLACGRCDACRLRLKGFADAGVRDPASYVDSVRGP
jgi:7-cyano-7-deazaguanine synthase